MWVFSKRNLLIFPIFAVFSCFGNSNCDRPLYPHPIVAQEQGHSCGAACLRSIFYARGLSDTSEEVLLNELQSSPEYGTSPDYLVAAILRRGFGAYSQFYLTIEQLDFFARQGESIIVSLMSHGVPHYAVYNGFDGFNVYLMDPWSARTNGNLQRVVPWQEFLAEWYYRDTTRAFFGHVIRVWSQPSPAQP